MAVAFVVIAPRPLSVVQRLPALRGGVLHPVLEIHRRRIAQSKVPSGHSVIPIVASASTAYRPTVQLISPLL
jgi:hypothetical protein